MLKLITVYYLLVYIQITSTFKVKEDKNNPSQAHEQLEPPPPLITSIKSVYPTRVTSSFKSKIFGII